MGRLVGRQGEECRESDDVLVCDAVYVDLTLLSLLCCSCQGLREATLHLLSSSFMWLLLVCFRYYQEKMGAAPQDQAPIIASIVKAYVEGLCWVMRYYYEGVASWEW